jgi:plastocyanin
MFLTSKHHAAVVAAVAIALSVAGCSKSNDQQTSTEASAPASLRGEVNDHGTVDLTGGGDAPDVSMELDDNYFGPTFLEVAPGVTVKVDLHNEGSRQHSVTTANGVDVVVDPGQIGEVELTAPDEGQLAFYCRFHQNTGMQGAVVVSTGGLAPAGGSSSSSSSTTSTTTSSGGGGYGY